MAVVHEGEPVLAPDQEARTVRELNEALADEEGVARLTTPSGEVIQLPHSIYSVLAQVASEMARGNAVRVLPVYAELTTQQAADLLNVSRPHLVKLLETEELPYTMVGRHRRIRLEDLLVYRDRRDEQRKEALDKLTRESQELGLYEEEHEEEA